MTTTFRQPEVLEPPVIVSPPEEIAAEAVEDLDSPQVLAESVEQDILAEAVESPELVAAEAIGEVSFPAPEPKPIMGDGKAPWPKSWPFIAWHGFKLAAEWLFGLASVIGCLAVLAAIPILNFISLGYLLEASGRVAKSGRIRDGFIDTAKFARIGSLVAGTWLWLWVPRFVSTLATDAWLIDPNGAPARAWRVGLIVTTVLVIGHILLAWYSGGRLRHFFWPFLAPFQLGAKLLFGGIVGPIFRPLVTALWPAFAEDLYNTRPLSEWFPPAILAAGIRRGGMYAQARDAVWDFIVSLRLPQYFWLGLRGFVGALAWLIVPSLMLVAGTSGPPVLILVGYLGAALMAFVLIYLPFLQTHFACQNRFTAIFEWSAVRQQFRRAPIAYWLALTITLLFALPLYLLKIEPPPRELWWTLTIFFILFIYPARLLTGWAVGRAMHHAQPRFWLFRWMSRLAAIPVVLFYLLILFFTQYTSYLGPASLLEQHAFLLPVPFLAL
ncbi:MAG TPA: hypothetical protein VFV87_07295 [Pirellulaceae bacterium]|nr:hypothetical protein [Pirellulaceae bacterium]